MRGEVDCVCNDKEEEFLEVPLSEEKHQRADDEREQRQRPVEFGIEFLQLVRQRGETERDRLLRRLELLAKPLQNLRGTFRGSV